MRIEFCRRAVWMWGVLATLLLSACASDIEVQRADFIPDESATPRTIVITASAVGYSTAGYGSHLKVSSHWQTIGRITQGTVFKPLDTVLMAEGKHASEAYIVISGNKWVGFWLPVQSAFSPLSEPSPIQTRDN